jgi:hypothetical protein
MVKDGTARGIKYGLKVDPDIARQRIVLQGASMRQNAITPQNNAYDTALFVRGKLNLYGVASTYTLPFIACANELAAKATRFGQGTLALEGTIVLNKWKARLAVSGTCPPDFVKVLIEIGAHSGVTWTGA